MLKLRLAIVSLFVSVLLSVLVLQFGHDGGSSLLGNFVPFTLVLIATVVLTLALPIRKHLNAPGVAALSVLAYLILLIGYQQINSAPIPAVSAIILQATSLFLIVALCCWVHSCITSFENSVYHFGLGESISNIRDPESEENIQSLLMNSRYTGQPLGFIAIDVNKQTKAKFQSRLIEHMLEKIAAEHWQTEVGRALRKELRIIDKFYTVGSGIGSGNRLLLMCPGLDAAELEALSFQLETAISDNAIPTSSCSYASFPNDALTLEGLLTRLDEASGTKTRKPAPRPPGRSSETNPGKKLATPELAEEQRD